MEREEENHLTPAAFHAHAPAPAGNRYLLAAATKVHTFQGGRLAVEQFGRVARDFEFIDSENRVPLVKLTHPIFPPYMKTSLLLSVAEISLPQQVKSEPVQQHVDSTRPPRTLPSWMLQPLTTATDVPAPTRSCTPESTSIATDRTSKGKGAHGSPSTTIVNSSAATRQVRFSSCRTHSVHANSSKI